MLFTEANFKEPILRGLTDLWYETMTPIQEQTITAFDTGKDIVWQSQTGTGKTAAFVLPLLNVIDPMLKKPQAIILAPTRELAMQTQEEFFNLGRYSRIRALAAYGWRSIFFQKKLLDEGMHVAVCTPGRAMDLIQRKFIDPTLIKYFVLDEVDRMLDMGFVDDVEALRAQCPNITQTMLFSATMTTEVQQIIRTHIGSDYQFIQIEPEKVVVDKIDHAFTIAPHISKPDLLVNWIESHKEHKIIIFTQTKYATNELTKFLYEKGYKVWQLSGDLDQRERTAALKAYKNNEVRIMIATDVASRWLNMKDIDLVINFDVPQDPESYVHRIGRTARAGKSGKAITFVTNNEMKTVELIERRNKIKIKQIDSDGNEIIRKAPERRDSSRSRSWWWRFGTRSRFGAERSGSRFSQERRSDEPYTPSILRGGSDQWSSFSGRSDRHATERKSYSSDRWSDRFPSKSRFGADRPDRSSYERSDKFGREKSSFSSSRPWQERRTYSSDRWGERTRTERPSTKSLLADIIPDSKPKRGSYRGKE